MGLPFSQGKSFSYLHTYYDRVTARILTAMIDIYACCSVDDGRATHAKQVLCEVRTKKWPFSLGVWTAADICIS